jgi:hypothetical protein
MHSRPLAADATDLSEKRPAVGREAGNKTAAPGDGSNDPTRQDLYHKESTRARVDISRREAEGKTWTESKVECRPFFGDL